MTTTVPIGGIKRAARNAASMLTSDVLNRGTTFVVYALVARYLGVRELGQMSLALILVYSFQVFAAAGLSKLITREVAKDKTLSEKYVVNSYFVVGTLSLLSIAALGILVRIMGYPSDTTLIIQLYSAALLPIALTTVTESIFRAWERMHYIPFANVPVNAGKVVFAYLFLSWGHGIEHLVLLLVACRYAILIVEFCLMLTCIHKPHVTLDLSFCQSMIRRTTTFLGIEGLIAIKASLIVLLLSWLRGESEVGLFVAAAPLTLPVKLMLDNVAVSIFPVMCRRFDTSCEDLKQISERLISFLLAIAFPASAGLFMLSDSAILLLYGNDDFLPAALVLRITVWALILSALTVALGHALLAGLREKITLRIVAINLLITLAVGLLLIGRFGLVGAAATVLITGIVNFLQHYVPVARLFSGISLSRLAWKPFVATLVMVGYLTVVKSSGVIFSIFTGAAIYGCALFVLLIWSEGGLHQFKTSYLNAGLRRVGEEL